MEGKIDVMIDRCHDRYIKGQTDGRKDRQMEGEI